MSPTDAGAVNGTVYAFHAYSSDRSEWEITTGAHNSSGAGSFARTTVLYNSAGTGTKQSGAGTKINFTAAPSVVLVADKWSMVSVEEDIGLTATQKAQARANIDALKRNYILNGAMMISQENGSTAGTTSSYYAADGWADAFVNGGATSFAQVASATPGGSPNRIRLTATTADASVAAGDFSFIWQNVEGLEVADLLWGTSSAKAITIQFGVKAPAGTYCVTVLNATPNRSYVAEYTISGGEANTDVVKSVTIPGDTSGTWAKDATVGMQIRFGLMAGTTYQQTAGSWSTGNVVGSSNQFNFMGTNSNVFELFDVGLYEGEAAPAFQVPHYAQELRKCMRYYETGTEPYSYLGGALTATAAYDSIKFMVTKRTTPTMSFSAGWTYYSGGGGGGFTPSAVNIGTDRFGFHGTGLTNWNGWINTGTWKASARL